MSTLNKVYLRGDVIPTEQQIIEAEKPNVTIFAPTWVRDALDELQEHLQDKEFEIVTTGTRSIPPFKLAAEITLKQLQMISRNEKDNMSGEIDFNNYERSITREVIYSLKDLTRQSVIVGRATAIKYGGYPRRNGNSRPQSNPVQAYIIDLIGLQFQQPYNSGRLVLSNTKSLPNGFLDNFIFKQVVGEEKQDFDTVHRQAARSDSRYVKVRNMPGHTGPEPTYFDKRAYKQFVKKDVVLTGEALLETARENLDSGINFKFLSYGTGFFAGPYEKILKKNILSAVLEGLGIILEKDSGRIIKQVEFTHYSRDGDLEVGKKLHDLKERFKVEVKFTDRDALEPEGTLITATTNCGDPHAPFGNEMNHGSVDAAIAENLELKGLQFIPALNKLMKEKYISLD